MLRFIPNINTGDLHIGHIVTYTINRFAALQIQEKGIRGIKDEKKAIGDFPNIITAIDHFNPEEGVEYEKHSKAIERNLFIIDILFLRWTSFLRIPTWYEARLLQVATGLEHHIRFKKKDRFMANMLFPPYNVRTFPTSEFIFDLLMKTPLFDALVGTNCFVRGRDLENNNIIEKQMECFRLMTDREYVEFWTPLVIVGDGKKVGKSAKEIASLYRLHKEGISDATFPLYAIYKLFNDTVPKLSNLWDRFDLERIAELPNWVFHEEELLELDKWVKKNWEYDDCYDDFWKTCFQSIMK
jgi:hypothetical protein|tara:strand:+ start:2127 stop:3020 length:894 start_codon:yes stop_codon:yes gene_type:complete